MSDSEGCIDLTGMSSSSSSFEESDEEEELYAQQLPKLIDLCKKKGLRQSLDAIKAAFAAKRTRGGKNKIISKRKKNYKKNYNSSCHPPPKWFTDTNKLSLHDLFVGDAARTSYIESNCVVIDKIEELQVGQMVVYIGDLGAMKGEEDKDEDEDEEEDEEGEQEEVDHQFVGVKNIIIGFTRSVKSRAKKPANMILYDPHDKTSSKVSFKSNTIINHYFLSTMSVKEFVKVEEMEDGDDKLDELIRSAQKTFIIGAIENPYEGADLRKVFSVHE